MEVTGITPDQNLGCAKSVVFFVWEIFSRCKILVHFYVWGRPEWTISAYFHW